MSLSRSVNCAVCKQPLSPQLSLTETSAIHKIMSYLVMKRIKPNINNESTQNNDRSQRVTCSRCNKVCCRNCVVWHRYGTSIEENNDSSNNEADATNKGSEDNVSFLDKHYVTVCVKCEQKPNLIRSLTREVWHLILSYCVRAEQQTMMQLCRCTQLGVDLPNYTYSQRGWCAFFNSKKLIYNGSLGPVYRTTLRSDIVQTLHESSITPSLLRLLYNKTVAVKVINKSRIYSLRQWGHVQREIDALVRCTKCRNVVSFYFALQGPSEVYLVMEYVAGGDLFDWLTQQALPMESEVKVIALQLLQTINELHETCGVVHRDIKPENILLEYSYESESESEEEEELEEFVENSFMQSAQCKKMNERHHEKIQENNKRRLHVRLADFGYAKLLPIPNVSRSKYEERSLKSQYAMQKQQEEEEEATWNEANTKRSKTSAISLHSSNNDIKKGRCTTPLTNSITNVNSDKTYLNNGNELHVNSNITNSNTENEKAYKCCDFPHITQKNTVLDKYDGHSDDSGDNSSSNDDKGNDDDDCISHKFHSFLIPATPCGTLGFAPPETINAYTAKKKALDYVQTLITHDSGIINNTALNTHLQKEQKQQQQCKDSNKFVSETSNENNYIEESNQSLGKKSHKDIQSTKNCLEHSSYSNTTELSHFKIADPLTPIEQIKRMDIFAAGVTLCILLTGCEPFPCESSKAHIEAVFRGVDFFAEEWSYVSFEAKNLIRQMLAPNAADRPSARECLESSWFRQFASRLRSSANTTKTQKVAKHNYSDNTKNSKTINVNQQAKRPNLPTGVSHLLSVHVCNHSTQATSHVMENDSLSNITSDAFYINVPQFTSSLRPTAIPLTITETLSESFRNSVGSLRRSGGWLFVQDATGSLTTMPRLSVKGDEENRVFNSHHFTDEHTDNTCTKNTNVINNNCLSATTNTSSVLESK